MAAIIIYPAFTTLHIITQVNRYSQNETA